MKKRSFLVFILALSLVVGSAFTILSEVYICDSDSATKYHYSPSCRGLNACKHEIIKVSKNKAEASGRTLCGWED